jgi:hypothetical protein
MAVTEWFNPLQGHEPAVDAMADALRGFVE